MRFSLTSVIIVAIGLVASSAVAQEDARAFHHPDEVEWAEVVPGIAFAATAGDWTEEAHGKLIRFEPGAAVPPHTHSLAYDGVVIEGRFTNPYPDDEGDPVVMGPGSTWHVPAETAHANECVSEDPCLIYTHQDGAWDIAVLEERAE